MTVPEIGTPLPDRVRDLIAAVSTHLPSETSEVLRRQAMSARTVAETATMLDVVVPPDSERLPLENGPLPVTALVVGDDEDPVGEILVWVRDGFLIGVEQAWVTDERPTQWPVVSSIRFRNRLS